MALADIKVKDAAGTVLPTQSWPAQAAATAMLSGEIVKMKTDGTGIYVIPLANGDGVIGTTSKIVGVVRGSSNATASADGVVDVYMPKPGVVYELKPKVATSCNTAAKILALVGKRVVIGLVSGVYTIDTAAADNASNAFMITGGDPLRDVCYFTIRNSATYQN